MTLKQDGGRHHSNLERVSEIFFLICSKSSTLNDLAHRTLKNIDNSIRGSQMSLGRRPRIAIGSKRCKNNMTIMTL